MRRILLVLLSCAVLPAQVQIQSVSDVAAAPSPFAGHALYGHRSGDPKLRQWVFVTLNATSPGAATLEVDDGTEKVQTPVTLVGGTATYVAYGAQRWPAASTANGVVKVLVSGNPVDSKSGVTLGSRRPWTVHLVSDVCDDDIWAFNTKAEELLASTQLSRAELDRMDADDTNNVVLHARNSYCAIAYRFVEDLLAAYPGELNRVKKRGQEGRLEIQPFPSTPLGASLSSAEIVHWMLPWRRMERSWQLPPTRGLNYQESLSLPWGLASLLHNLGVVGVSYSPFQWSGPPVGPLEYWEGPDGSRILWHQTVGYWEASYLPWDQVLAKTGSTYEPFGASVYPWSQCIVFGTYVDLFPGSYTDGGRSGRIAQLGWAALQAAHPGAEYPRIESSTQSRFYDAIAAERLAHPGIDAGIPVRKGDFGADWDAWTLGLAAYGAKWRQLLATLPAMDALNVLAENGAPGHYQSIQAQAETAHREVGRLSDHAWAGSDLTNRRENARLRKQWASTADQAARATVGASLASLGSKLATGTDPVVMFFNKELFAIDTRGYVDLGAAGLGTGPYRAIDVATGSELPAQTNTGGASPMLAVDVGTIPACGWRLVRLVPGAPSEPSVIAWAHAPTPQSAVLDAGGSRIRIDVAKHQISSWTFQGRELLVPGRSIGIVGDGSTVVPAITDGKITAISAGAVQATVTLSGTVGGVAYTSRLRLDLRDGGLAWDVDVAGNLTLERGPLFHAGIATGSGQTWLQGPLAVFRAGHGPSGDQVPGSPVDWHQIDRFLDLVGNDAGMVVSSSDTGAVFVDGLSSYYRTIKASVAFPLFGRGWASFPQEKLADQNGESALSFRFHMLPHGPGFDPMAAYRFASAVGRHAPLAHVLPPSQQGVNRPLFSAASVMTAGVVGTSLGISEEGPARGTALTLWDITLNSAATRQVRIECDGMGGIATGNRTDLLQRDLSGAANDFVPSGGRGQLAIKSRGIAAVRLGVGRANPTPPAITSVVPAALVTLAPGRTVRIVGSDVGAAVAVRIGGKWYGRLSRVDADTLDVLVEKIEAFGNATVEVLAPNGFSNAFPITVQAPTQPLLDVQPAGLDPGRASYWLSAATPGDAHLLFCSLQLGPWKPFPGMIEMDIGGAAGPLFLAGGVSDPAGYWSLRPIYPGGGGPAVFLQVLIGRPTASGFLFPAPVSNVVKLAER